MIVMDAPPPREDCVHSVRIAALLTAAGVQRARGARAAIDTGFLLLSDLGRRPTWVRGRGNADRLFADALDTLVRWQLATRPAC